ncbi:MAG: hypothetical protein SF069_00170 [Phycisphaerae bacterium]|nr:hypothetical protein [Phycisphaerae bacterium]
MRASRVSVHTIFAVALVGGASLFVRGVAFADDKPQPPAPPAKPAAPAPPAAPAAAASQPAGQRGGFDLRNMGDMLVKGLEESPGCLGVERARTVSGKFVIFAWFENKKAAMAWYNNPVHVGMMGAMAGGGTPGYVPMKHISDDCGPLLAVASLVPPAPAADGAAPSGPSLAIEVYESKSAAIVTDSKARFSPTKVGELFEARTPKAAK